MASPIYPALARRHCTLTVVWDSGGVPSAELRADVTPTNRETPRASVTGPLVLTAAQRTALNNFVDARLAEIANWLDL